MTAELTSVSGGVRALVAEWEGRLAELDEETITKRINGQVRSIKQITGHMIDSASNNTHRVVHLQYGQNPLTFPDYSADGNNDRWIAIQDYQNQDWDVLVQLWKYSNLHIAHVMENIDTAKLDHRWIADPGSEVTLRDMAVGYLWHLKLHLGEIEELLTTP